MTRNTDRGIETGCFGTSPFMAKPGDRIVPSHQKLIRRAHASSQSDHVKPSQIRRSRKTVRRLETVSAMGSQRSAKLASRCRPRSSGRPRRESSPREVPTCVDSGEIRDTPRLELRETLSRPRSATLSARRIGRMSQIGIVTKAKSCGRTRHEQAKPRSQTIAESRPIRDGSL